MKMDDFTIVKSRKTYKKEKGNKKCKSCGDEPDPPFLYKKSITQAVLVDETKKVVVEVEKKVEVEVEMEVEVEENEDEMEVEVAEETEGDGEGEGEEKEEVEKVEVEKVEGVEKKGEKVKDKEKRKLGGGVIMNSELTKILLVRNKTSKKWGIPKGGIEEGESDFDGALREISEETGLTIHAAGGIKMAPCITLRSAKIFLFCFPMQAIKTNPIDTNEIDQVEWFPITNIHPNDRKFTTLLRDLIRFRMPAIRNKIMTNLINYSVYEGQLVINQYLSAVFKKCDKARIADNTVISSIQDKFPLVFYQPELLKHFAQKRERYAVVSQRA
jgi:ADP-ribose pyrophosphatase YjhB (NUDIX family)